MVFAMLIFCTASAVIIYWGWKALRLLWARFLDSKTLIRECEDFLRKKSELDTDDY